MINKNMTVNKVIREVMQEAMHRHLNAQNGQGSKANRAYWQGATKTLRKLKKRLKEENLI